MNKKCNMKIIKEISLIITGIILLFGGLGVFLSNELVNGITLIGIVMIGAGGALLAYILKDGWSR